MKKTIFCLLILISAQMVAQHTLEKGIQILTLQGATVKNAAIEITGTGIIQNNKATSPSETAVEEIDLSFLVQVSALDSNGTFKYGIGKQASLAGTYVEVSGNSTESKIQIYQMNNTAIIPVKEFKIPFKINTGEIYKIRMAKRIRALFVEISNPSNYFITDTLKYPSLFFGLAWGIPFIACSNGTISISDYELTTPFSLSPRLVATGDSFIEGSSVDTDKLRYISYIKDSIGYGNIAIMGKGGESSVSMNNRFIAESKWFAGATYELLAVGVNDQNFITWQSNINNYIQVLKKKGIIPILATLTPRDDRTGHIIEVNKWIRNSYNGAYVDINKVVATDDIHWLPSACMSDNIHPTAASHKNIFYRIALEAPYLFREKKTFTVDFINETTMENVITSIQYSTFSNFTSVSSGLNTPVSLTPGKDLYFKSANSVNIKIIEDILLVPDRPARPSNISTPFTPGLFDWINTPGFENVGNYEYSVDNGITWTTCSEKPTKNINTGAIDLRVKASNKNFRSLSIHIDHLTSIGFHELKHLRIYPNPVKTNLTIDQLSDKALASIYASDGRLVQIVSIAANSSTIVSLEALPRGIYMLVIVTDKGNTQSFKLIKEE